MAFNFTTLDSSNLRSVQFILVQCSVSLLAVPKFTHVYQVHRRRRVVEQNQTFGLNKSNGSKNQEKLTRSTKKSMTRSEVIMRAKKKHRCHLVFNMKSESVPNDMMLVYGALKRCLSIFVFLFNS